MCYNTNTQTNIGGNMSEREQLKKNERDLRLTAFHMAREILNEQRHFGAQLGQSVNAPTTEEIKSEAEKILTFLKK